MKKLTKKSQTKYKEIELDLSDRIFLFLAKKAHEADVTFNEYINQQLKEYIDELEKKNEKIRYNQRSNQKV